MFQSPALIASLFLLATSPESNPGTPIDSATIERLVGVKGTFNEKEGVFKVSSPRTDLAVTAAGVKLTPPMGLTSWAAFHRASGHTMVMGDTVLLEDQVNPVMSVALESGLEVTALHNHFFWESPRIMYMHIAGMGDEATLAAAVARVWAKLRETSGGKGVVTRADVDPARSTLDPKRLDAVFGRTGDYKSGVYKLTFGRETTVDGQVMGDAMGVNTWAAFAGSDDRAIVDGDFAMLEGELQGVLKALRHGGIDVVAIHQHMTGETPRMMFLHYWGAGKPEDLARTLVSALAQTKKP
jgi:hypothetical protein